MPLPLFKIEQIELLEINNINGLTTALDSKTEASDFKTVGGESIIGSGDIPTTGGITVEDNVTSTSTTNALSVNQGRLLQEQIDTIGNFTPQELTSDISLTSNDSGKLFFNDSANTYTVTIPSGLPLNFNAAFVKFSTGNIRILDGVGVTADTNETVDLGVSFVISQLKPEQYFYIGSLNSFSAYTPINNFYTLANAANPDNEVDATTGFVNNGNTTVISIADVDGSSNFSIEGEQTAAGGFSALQTTITGLTDNQAYTVTLRIKQDSGNANPSWLFGWTGIDETINQTITNTSYQEVVVPITMNGTSLTITIYPSDNGGVGDKFQLSSITIV